jgi:Flp pilus assembly protein TadG
MVEFALVAPLGFLLLLSVLVVGIVVTNYIQLSNEAREGARVAAICGSDQTALIPDGSGLPCTGANISGYITSRLVSLPAGSVTPQISVISGSSSCALVNPTCHCQVGSIVEVVMSYDQPLYLPLLSNLLQTNSNGTMRLSASAEATCEQ